MFLHLSIPRRGFSAEPFYPFAARGCFLLEFRQACSVLYPHYDRRRHGGETTSEYFHVPDSIEVGAVLVMAVNELGGVVR